MTQKIHPLGKIYAIRSFETDDIYIGSTFNPLYKRLASHKNHFKKYKNGTWHKFITSFKILEHNDAYIELLEEYQNLTKDQLNKYEGEYIRKMKCVNKCIMGRSRSEYYIDNKDIILECSRQYYINNKDVILEYNRQYNINNKERIKKLKNEKIICESGKTFTRSNKNKHIKTKKHIQYLNKTEEIK